LAEATVLYFSAVEKFGDNVTEEHANRASCLKREQQIKGWTRAKKDALISGDPVALKKA
jgi:predicted GIY-YIG superfamily endonuclease